MSAEHLRQSILKMLAAIFIDNVFPPQIQEEKFSLPWLSF
jgi:hypothetical protein